VAKVAMEESKKLTKEQALEEGRFFGAIGKHAPETMRKISVLAEIENKRKLEVVSEALEHYYEIKTMGGVWRTIHSMTPDQLQAAWQLFRYLMNLARSIYVDMAKDFIEGTVARYMELLESARSEGYEAARRSFEAKFKAKLERKKTEKLDKILDKLDPLLDVFIDQMTDHMVRMMGKTPPKKKLKVPIEVVEH